MIDLSNTMREVDFPIPCHSFLYHTHMGTCKMAQSPICWIYLPFKSHNWPNYIPISLSNTMIGINKHLNDLFNIIIYIHNHPNVSVNLHHITQIDVPILWYDIPMWSSWNKTQFISNVVASFRSSKRGARLPFPKTDLLPPIQVIVWM